MGKTDITSAADEHTPLLERDRELGAVTESISAASEGRGSLLLVEGPPGIGKTRILMEAAARARKADLLVRSARAGEMEREMPFGVVRQLFETMIERASSEERDTWLSGSARRALGALGLEPAGTSQPDKFTPINGLYWLVANVSETRPVMLLIDDAHWSDVESLRFVSFLARRIQDLPVCLVIGSRVGEASEPEELRTIRIDAPAVHPQPLSEASVAELIETRVGRTASGEFAAACVRATAGNPFLVVEILRELSSWERELDASAAESILQMAPEGVARSVLFRLSRFGEEAIALARAIVILGRPPQFRFVAELVGLDESRVVSLCDRLRDAEILSPRLPLDFIHPLVRQAIYNEMSEGERSMMHRRAAEILDGFGAGPQDIAAHLLLCVPNGDQWVVERLKAAANTAAQVGALDGVVTYLERALKEPPRDPAPLLNRMGRALVETEPFRAPQVLSEAVKGDLEPRAKVEVLGNLVWALATAGNLSEAADRCEDALDVAGDSDRELTLALEAQRCFLRLGASGADPNVSARMEGVAAALPGETPGERVARQALALNRYISCASIGELAELTFPFPPLPWVVAGGESFVPIAATKLMGWCGYWKESRAELSSFLEMCHRDGRVVAVSAGNGFLSELERSNGNLVEAEALARTAWEIAESVGGQFSTVGWSAFMNLAATLLARGDLEAFEALIGDFDLSFGPFEVPVNPWPIEIRAHYRWAKGELEGGAEDLLDLGEKLEARGWLTPIYPPWRQDAAELLAALGRTKEADEILSVAEDRGRGIGSPQLNCSILRARALLEPRKRAISLLERSVREVEASGPPHELARSLIELGGALRRDGQKKAARPFLQRALELAHRAGARLLETRAREELGAVGARPRSAYQTGVGSLTASELRIARLAAEGLNNREIAERLFVTRRTVETHLTHAYEKLLIGGRADLAGALSEGGVTPT